MSEVQAALFGTEAEPKTTELPELPMGWAWAKLSEIALEVSPGFPSGRHNQQGLGVPHLRPMNVNTNGTIELTEVKYVQETSYTPLLEGDILFNNTNSPDLVGKTAWIPRDTNWAYSNHMTRIRVDQKQFEPRWLAGYLHYLYKRGYYKLHCRNHVNQASIGTGFLLAMAIPVPPLQEQRRIVEKLEELLSDLDAGVATLRQALAKLKRYRQAVLKAAVEGELSREWREANKHRLEPASKLLERILAERRSKSSGDKKYREPEPPNTSELPELPEGWVWATIGQVLAEGMCNGLSVKASDTPTETRALRLNAMTEQGFDYGEYRYLPVRLDEVADLLVEENDFFVSRGNGSLHLVGRGTLAQPAPFKVIFPDTMIRLRFDEKLRGTRWIPSIWHSRFIRRQIERRVKTTAGIWKVSQPQLASIVFPLPPLQEQAYIVAEVDRRLSEADRLEATLQANLKRAERLRQAILKKAFSGELVPQDPNDEPASVLLEPIRASRAQAPKKGKRKQ